MLFDAWDEDKSGTLTKPEIKQLWTNRLNLENVVASAMCEGTFLDTIYKLNNGYLDIFPSLKENDLDTFAIQTSPKLTKELMALQKANEKAHIDSIIDKIFEKADTDKNGTLSKQEFVTFFSNDETLAEMALDTSKEFDDHAEKSAYELGYGFLITSSDPVAKKWGEYLKSECKDESLLVGIPEDIKVKIGTMMEEMNFTEAQ